MKKWIILMLSMPLLAQNVTIDVTPRIIGINETVSLSVTIEGGQQGRSPSFIGGIKPGDFKLLSRSPSTQTRMSMINGVTSSQVTYTYTLQPSRKGKLTFPAQNVKYDGKTYSSEAIEVEVGDAIQRASRPSAFDPFNRRPRRNTQRQTKLEVIAALETDKDSYYLGEPITLNVSVYLTPGLDVDWSRSSLDMPELGEFWTENLPFTNRARRAKYQDKVYTRYQITKRLYANRAGAITIPQASLQLAVGRAPITQLFPNIQLVDRTTSDLTLDIRELPAEGRPANFSGLVGNFKLASEVDSDQIKLGETISLKLILSGNGSFRSLNEIPLNHLEGQFEVFKGGLPTSTEKDGLTTSKTWAFALVPRREGNFTITAPNLHYFDLQSKSYKALEAPAIDVQVNPGQGLGEGARVTSGPANDQTLITQQNLQYIKRAPLEQGTLKRPNRPDLLIHLVLVILAIDLVLFIALFVKDKAGERRAGQRPAYALKNFNRAMAKMKGVDEDPDIYYGALSQAVFNYFGDKWERPGQGVSLDMISERFHKLGIDSNLYEKIAEVIEGCDLARFTPSTPESRENLTQRAKTVITEVEGALK